MNILDALIYLKTNMRWHGGGASIQLPRGITVNEKASVSSAVKL